jgi:thiol:disulfide interchange protein
MRYPTNSTRRRLAAVLAAALLLGATGCSEKGPTPYDARADARADLNLALGKARTESKRVLVVFGANWCADCQALARHMAQEQVAAHIGKRYVVTKVDVGDFNKNLDLAQQMGDTIKKGIPAVAVLASDGTFQRATQAGELASARKLGPEQVLAVLDGLVAPAAN